MPEKNQFKVGKTYFDFRGFSLWLFDFVVSGQKRGRKGNNSSKGPGQSVLYSGGSQRSTFSNQNSFSYPTTFRLSTQNLDSSMDEADQVRTLTIYLSSGMSCR